MSPKPLTAAQYEALRATAAECLNSYFSDYFLKRDLKRTLTHIDLPRISGFGTGADETLTGSQEIVDLFLRDMTDAPNPITMSNTNFRYDITDAETFVAWGTLDIETTIEQTPIRMENLRFSLRFGKQDGTWKINHKHMSFPYVEQAEDESYPLKELRRRNEELEVMVASRTHDLEVALADKEILLREVHHRIKNNLTAVSSLLGLQAREQPDTDAGAALEAARGRVTSMAIIYDRLYQSDIPEGMSIQPYLSELLDHIRAAYATAANVRIESHCEDIHLDMRFLFPIGIIINELITNAYKYAFIGRETGTIRITVSRPVDRLTNTVEIVVQDDGCGIPAAILTSDDAYGFGLTLVHILTRQISGTLQMTNEHGARFVVSFQPE